jgi:naphthalene 1,2-dioxygenase subunit alpha
MVDVSKLINTKDGIQSRRIFHDQDIYDLEMERIFARCWLFLTHESLIPNAGDFITTKMGQDNVIVVRQQNGKVRAFVNSCSHRGARVCAAEAGNTRSFVCSYHGWAYGIDGSLQGVPLEKEVYNNQLDKFTHGLVEVALVDSFCGFIYGCFDSSAPSLREFLGEAAWYLEAWMGVPGGTELIGPPSRSMLYCNWKTPGENFIGDMYHVGWTHASSTQVLFPQSPLMALQGNASLPAPAEVMGLHFTSRAGTVQRLLMVVVVGFIQLHAKTRCWRRGLQHRRRRWRSVWVKYAPNFTTLRGMARFSLTTRFWLAPIRLKFGCHAAQGRLRL